VSKVESRFLMTIDRHRLLSQASLDYAPISTISPAMNIGITNLPSLNSCVYKLGYKNASLIMFIAILLCQPWASMSSSLFLILPLVLFVW
jgi:hypothetical protein